MQVLKTVAFAGLLASTHAHFMLNYPATRGFDHNIEPNFCGGFPVASNRSQFPLSGGIVTITSQHPKADVDILISFSSNPTTFGDFNKTASGTSIPFLMPFTTMNAQGDACFPVNISSLGMADAKNGANATIMVQYDGGDGQLYQCADVILSSSFTVPSGTPCTNVTGAFSNSNPSTNTTGGALSGAPAAMTGLLGAFASAILLLL